jgi:CRISPR-associated protein Cmr1
MTLEDKIKILRSLWGMAMFGGLGSRSRRGLGSSTVIPQEGNKTLPTEFPRFRFKNRDDFIGEIESFAKTVRKDKGLPNFTSFSAASRIIVTKDFKGGQLPSGVSAWQAINDQFKAYRDYYGRPRTKHTEKDHHLMRDFLQGGEPPPSVAPQRAAFGLPHNYYFTRSLNRVKGFVDLIADDDGQPYQLIAQDDNPDNFELEEKKKEARRASPLFIHIHKFENGNASAVITFLPAVFIPPKKKIRLSGNGRYLYVDAPGFRAIEDFLQVLRNDPSNKEITP